MALLEDPTIQRILDDVNRAASGGALGTAGNYISKPIETMAPFENQLLPPENNFFNQDQTPLFYPTPEMFKMGGLTTFDNNIDLESMPTVVPMAKPSNFDYYGAGLYNTMPQNFLSPYENFTGMNKLSPTQPMSNNIPVRRTSNVSSTNNDQLPEHPRHHQDYRTLSSTMSVPNLGLNVRTTSQPDPISIDVVNPSDVQVNNESMSNEFTNTKTPLMHFISDNENSNSLPLINNEETDNENSNAPGQIFYDPNPQIIQRKGSHSVTYKQNIIVRFLQPPPITNPGPLIIKEVRAPQPSPLPPLVIKQRPTPPKTPPPLIIREKPPPLPSTFATKVITRQLPPEPAPPRAVIIERLPPLPPKPRDIIIERWLPYEFINQKRKVIIQRAPKLTKEFPQPKNIIITYEPVHAKIVRNFQKQNTTREDPQAYMKRFGPQLQDPNLVIQQARAVGILEDLSPPRSFVPSMTNNVGIGTDYELSTTIKVEENQHEQNTVENNEKVEENNTTKEQEQPETVQPSLVSPVPIDDNGQEDDVLIEENVTPFYMNSGEDLQQTLHRLGIDLSHNSKNEQNF